MVDKPVFRVGVAGLETRDLRLIEIVFRHSQYNKYAFRLLDAGDAGDAGGYDLLIANVTAPAGQRAIAGLSMSGERKPVISALARGAEAAEGHAISIDRLTLQLLPILNRVVDLDLGRADESRSAEEAPAGTEQRRPADDVELAAARVGGEPAGNEPVAGEAVGHDPLAAEPVGTEPVEREPVEREPVELEPAELEPAEHEPVEREPFEHEPFEHEQVATESALPLEPSATLEPPQPEASERAEPEADTRPPEVDEEPDRPPADADLNLVRFPASSVGPGGAPARVRVLVVDDSPTVRRQLTVALERLGLGCETVDSAARALERLSEEHFDLALVDVVMPDADGYKLTRDIKRDRRLRQMPVIILTSRSSPFDLARGALSGCDAYLSKPVPFRALEAAVLKQLRRSLPPDELSHLAGSRDSSTAQDEQSRSESRLARLFRR